MKHENLKCTGIMQDNLCHPYILSTTLRSDRLDADPRELRDLVSRGALSCRRPERSEGATAQVRPAAVSVVGVAALRDRAARPFARVFPCTLSLASS